MLRSIDGLPVRVFDDLRVETDPGAQLQPQQAFALAEHIIGRAVQRQRDLRRQNAAVPKAPAVARDWA